MASKGRKTAFIERFGRRNAARILSIAEEHKEARAFDEERGYGSDQFRWAVLMVISFQCVEVDRFREHHRFDDSLTWSAFDAWLKEAEQREWLSEHDGDVDFLAVFGGAYNDYMPEGATLDA